MSKQDELKKELDKLNAKRKQSNVDIEALQENRNKLDARHSALEAKIADEAKPKLRHGDYGALTTLSGLHMAVYIDVSGENGAFADVAIFAEDVASVNRTHMSQWDSYSKVNFVKYGNIFDEITSLQEDVTEFKTKATGFNHNCGSIRVGDADDGLIFMQFKSRCDGTCHMTRDQFEEHIMSGRKKIATLKRNEAKEIER
jgi:mRNA-degrading endonuclease RelE of RelBE toxin-antitoxin system